MLSLNVCTLNMHNDETLSTTAGPATSNITMATSVNSSCCMLNYRQRHCVHLSFQTTKTTKSKHKNTISCSIKIIWLNFLITLNTQKQGPTSIIYFHGSLHPVQLAQCSNRRIDVCKIMPCMDGNSLFRRVRV